MKRLLFSILLFTSVSILSEPIVIQNRLDIPIILSVVNTKSKTIESQKIVGPQEQFRVPLINKDTQDLVITEYKQGETDQNGFYIAKIK